MFATLTETKAHLSITTTTFDAMLNNFLFGSGGRLLSILGLRQVAQATYSEVLDIRRREATEVKLRSYPVVSVASVTYKGRLITSGHYIRPIARLKLKSEKFYQSNQETEVEYTAGFDTASPAGTDLMFEAFKLAQLEAVRVWFSQHQATTAALATSTTGPLKRREIGEFVEEYHNVATATAADIDGASSELPATARGMIRQFIRRTPVLS